ncbi:MAG TPA: tetratricopeptide repeat protein [Longimicrobiales bacterium]|nr:tetratricopeptide repeat protein [Longimicrobiales bacterium]
MTSIAKLKDRARKHEQAENWQAAIEAYQKVLAAEEGRGELELELGLFNRIGDLYLRLGQTHSAVSYYEQAADKYAEAGFFNNAIALCNKALRHRPERAEIYLKLSRLCADQGFVTDARRWILEYAEREVKAGRVAGALSGLSDFVENSADPDVREFLAQQLSAQGRKEEAAVQFARAHEERMERGETDAAERSARRARSLDPSIALDQSAGPRRPSARRRPADDDHDEEPGGYTELPGFDTLEEVGPTADDARLADVEGLEPPAAPAYFEEDIGADELPGLEVSYGERAPEASPEDLEDDDSLGGLETFETLDLDQDGEEEAGAGQSVEDAEPLPLMDEESDPLPFLGVETPEEAEEPEELAELEDLAALEDLEGPEGLEDFEEPEALEPLEELAELDDLEEPEPVAASEPGGGPLDLGTLDFTLGLSEAAPGMEAEPLALDTDAILARARELVSRGLGGDALREISLLSGAEASPEVFRQAVTIVNEIIRTDPDDLAALQHRVDFAGRSGDAELLVRSYLDLGAAHRRAGADTKAQAMFERVLDLDPENAAARAALGDPAAATAGENVDLDAILRDIQPEDFEPEDAGAGATAEDEAGDPAFVAMLSQFKARVSEQGETEDAGDHYDLGLAFKEMGLIDEAIAEFQTALNGGEERLKVYEELGQCFIFKGQYTVALKIFARALQVPHQDRAELLGVYYHLGQCHEELGQREKAREAYQQVLAIDPSFQDVPDRMARL